MIFGDSYADNSSTSLWEMLGIFCGIVFVLVIFCVVGGSYLVACIFIAEWFGNQMFFPFVFVGIPILSVLVNGWRAK